jgi:hypothetical protein
MQTILTNFFYHPVTVKSILGETLQDFKVSYWGIGKPFFVQRGTCIDSVVGTGRTTIDGYTDKACARRLR